MMPPPFCSSVSIHARDRATRRERGYIPPVPDYPLKKRGFQPELVFANIIKVYAQCRWIARKFHGFQMYLVL
jgi:hypothetical protein